MNTVQFRIAEFLCVYLNLIIIYWGSYYASLHTLYNITKYSKYKLTHAKSNKHTVVI